MKIQELLTDYSIPFQTEGHKHCRPGWVNIPCPFCTGNPGLHLGYNEEKEYWHCWRCGSHKIEDVLITLLNISYREAKNLIKEYQGKTYHKQIITKPKARNFKFPSNCERIGKGHRKYLEKRQFDPEKIEKEWKILGTGPISTLDGKEYKHRIIIPIQWNGKIVSFQGRDITGKTKLRYKACPADREIIPHQTILYGNQTKWKDVGICVEGVTDVWRLGSYSSSFATFGISLTPSQIQVITRHFKRVIIIFDDDPQAQKQADKLMSELRFRGVQAYKESIIGDPANLKQEEANALVKEITRRIYK